MENNLGFSECSNTRTATVVENGMPETTLRKAQQIGNPHKNFGVDLRAAEVCGRVTSTTHP